MRDTTPGDRERRPARRRPEIEPTPLASPGTQRVLELDRVLALAAEHAASEEARQGLLEPHWLDGIEELRERLEQVVECRELLEHKRSLSMLPLADAASALEKLLDSPTWLDGSELNELAAFLELVEEVAKEVGADLPRLALALERLAPLPECLAMIRKMIDEAGQLKDKASPELHRLRKDFRREEGRIRGRLEKQASEWIQKGWITDAGLGWRDGRPVVQVPAGAGGRIDGIVVDQSQSGRTLFVEPALSLEHRGLLNRLEQEIRREEQRLYTQIADRLRGEARVMRRNRGLLTTLDGWLARARYAIETKGELPRVTEEALLEIREGRHPLLLRTVEVVPLEMRLGPRERVLVISGPNAGGKTVAMKTVGLFVLMIRAGLLPPCAEGTTLPLVETVLCDIGDQQSIDNDLSTYSSHLERMRGVTEQSRRQGLFLVDELGSGTDPEEGSAIAMSFLERMASSPGLTIASTHLGQLKAFAHDTEGLRNGSMSFDEERITPTYRYVDGVPGSSYALEILERMGLPRVVRDRARHYMDSEQKNLARLVADLQARLAQVKKKLSKIEAREIELDSLVSQYRERMKSSRKEAREIKRMAMQEASTILKEANRLVDRTVRDLKKNAPAPEEVRKARETIREKDRQLEKRGKKLAPRPRRQAPERLPQAGERVRLEGLETPAEVLRVEGRRIQVQAGIMKMSVEMSRVIEVLAPEGPRPAGGAVRHGMSGPASARLDLRGMTGDEAMSAVDAYIDECMIGGLSPVTIVHGKGDGILRRVVQEHLGRFDCVSSFRRGTPEEGGDGVTIVKVDS